MRLPHRLRDDESGMVGKIIVIWLLMLALLGVVALDAGSVVVATFRISDTAAVAATAAAAAYRTDKGESAACAVARGSVERSDPDVQFPKAFCKIDSETGRVTITIKEQASTIVAGRLSFTEDLTIVVGRETAGPSVL